MLHMEVAIDETWHQGVPIPWDHTRGCAFPFLYPLRIAHIDDVFAPDCYCLCDRFILICGEDVCVSDDDVSIGGHKQSPVILVG